jgi:hypothetical protein
MHNGPGGSGRLYLASLGLCLAVPAAARYARRAVKVALLALVPVALAGLADARRAAVGSTETGLESVVRPMWSLARVFDAYQAGEFRPVHGWTFLSLPSMAVPGWLWEHKPVAFGYQIAIVTNPENYGTGYSDAATVYGEWVYNFGLLGLLLMIPVVGYAVRRLDKGLAEVRQPLYLAGATLLACGVPDFVWNGLHSYGARTLLRLPVIVVLAVLVRLRAGGCFPDGEGRVRRK